MHFFQTIQVCAEELRGKNVTFSLPSRLRFPSVHAERNLKAEKAKDQLRVLWRCGVRRICSSSRAGASQPARTVGDGKTQRSMCRLILN